MSRPRARPPTYAVIGLGCLSTVLLLSALVNEKAFNYILGIASLLFFSVYILQTIGLLVGVRKGTIPQGEPGTFDLGRFRVPVYVTALVVFLAVAMALIFLPQFAGNGWVFLGIVAVGACGGGAPDCVVGSAAARPDQTSPAPTWSTTKPPRKKGITHMTIHTEFATSNLVSVEPGAIREDTPARVGHPIQ